MTIEGNPKQENVSNIEASRGREPKLEDFILPALVVGGLATAAAWESNLGGIKEKTKSAAKDVLENLINSGKKELNQVANDLMVEALERGRKKLFETLGISKKTDSEANQGKEYSEQRSYTPESYIEKLRKKDLRLSQLLDSDSTFSTELEKIEEHLHREIVSLLKNLSSEKQEKLLKHATMVDGVMEDDTIELRKATSNTDDLKRLYIQWFKDRSEILIRTMKFLEKML